MRYTCSPNALKIINAKKKQLTWGDVPPIYQLAASALSDLEGILTHGFDSAYKQILDKNTWNLTLLLGNVDQQGEIYVKHKPQIVLQHLYTKHHYELHCYPFVNGEKLMFSTHKDPNCPFIDWQPESMQMLFRINSLVSFIIYAYRKGDEADYALIKFSHFKVLELIEILRESFEIVDVIGYNIGEFCQEIGLRNQED